MVYGVWNHKELSVEKSQVRTLLVLVIGFVVSLGFFQPAIAGVSSQPTVLSFTMTPSSIDIGSANNTVTLDLQVTSPTGIASIQSLATITNGASISMSVPLLRTDSPINTSRQKVEFKGSITFTSSLPTGPYTASATPIVALNADGSTGYSTQSLTASTSSQVVGAKNALLIRLGGDLNFNFATFNGPAFNRTSGFTYVDPKYNSVASPIWKAGESINLSDYYELTVPGLTLKVKSKTTNTCTADGSFLSLIGVGGCEYIIYTDKTSDYQYHQDDQVISIAAARTKPVFSVGTITTQNSTSLPLQIPGPFIFGPFGLVIPTSGTPSVCYASGTTITVISGGTCTLNYSSPASANYLASDIFPLTFQITRIAQTISFSPPPTVTFVSRTLALSATASSGASTSFVSNSPTICSVTGNSLNLLKAGSCVVEAVQVGNATIAPAFLTQTILITPSKSSSKKTVCIKAGKTKTVVGTKCPIGYKVKQ